MVIAEMLADHPSALALNQHIAVTAPYPELGELTDMEKDLPELIELLESTDTT